MNDIKNVIYRTFYYIFKCQICEICTCLKLNKEISTAFFILFFFICSATSVYLECVDNVISVCGLKNALTSTSSMLTYINDTREETHKWLSRYNCISGKKLLSLWLYKTYFLMSSRGKTRFCKQYIWFNKKPRSRASQICGIF